MMTFSHAYHSLLESVRFLSTSADPIQSRLIKATMQVYVLSEDSFANHPDLLDGLEALKEILPVIDTSSREQIVVTFSRLTNEDGERLAGAILDFFLEVARIYCGRTKIFA